MPDIPAATNTAEKNGVFSNSTPTCGGRLGSSRCAQCRRDRGAVPEMVAPADERILEVDAPIVDIDQRGQQVGDGGKRRLVHS